MANDVLRRCLNKLAENHDFISGRQIFWWYCGLSWSHWWWQRHSLSDRFVQTDVSPADVIAKLKAYEASTGIKRWWCKHILRREALCGLVVRGLMEDGDGQWMEAIKGAEMGWGDWLPDRVKTWKNKAVDALVEYASDGVRAATEVVTDSIPPEVQAGLSPAEQLWAQWAEDKAVLQEFLETKCQVSRIIQSNEESAKIAQSIKQQYRQLAKKYHPDKNPDAQITAKQIFQALQAVFENAAKAIESTPDYNDLMRKTMVNAREALQRDMQEIWEMLRRDKQKLDEDGRRFEQQISLLREMCRKAEETHEKINRDIVSLKAANVEIKEKLEQQKLHFEQRTQEQDETIKNLQEQIKQIAVMMKEISRRPGIASGQGEPDPKQQPTTPGVNHGDRPMLFRGPKSTRRNSNRR